MSSKSINLCLNCGQHYCCECSSAVHPWEYCSVHCENEQADAEISERDQ